MADINIFLLFKTGLFFHRRPHHQQVDARRTTKTTKCFHVKEIKRLGTVKYLSAQNTILTVFLYGEQKPKIPHATCYNREYSMTTPITKKEEKLLCDTCQHKHTTADNRRYCSKLSCTYGNHYEPKQEKNWTCPPDCYLIGERDTENHELTVCTQCTRNPEVKDQYLTRQQYLKEYGVNPDF